MDLELRSLRSELSALREEVSALRLRVAELEADREFEVVGEDSPRPSSVPASPERPAADAANSSTSGYPAVRVEAAKETGRFFKRCLKGTSRGLSGRERVQLPSRIYVLVRSINGEVFTSPVQVFKSYNQIHPHVKLGQSLGDSVFAGFPSKWEAQLAVETAGYSWPTVIHG